MIKEDLTSGDLVTPVVHFGRNQIDKISKEKSSSRCYFAYSVDAPKYITCEPKTTSMEDLTDVIWQLLLMSSADS